MADITWLRFKIKCANLGPHRKFVVRTPMGCMAPEGWAGEYYVASITEGLVLVSQLFREYREWLT